MARRSSSQPLAVWTNGELVGRWTPATRRPMELRYEDSWLAATDGHAKNFSIRLHAGGAYSLTPLYDVLSAWPIIGNGKNQLAWRNAKLAMAVSSKNRHYALATIMRRHFNATAAKCGWGENAEDIISELLDRVESAIAAVTRQMPVDFPQDVAEAIIAGVRKQVQRLQAQPSA